MEPKSYNEHDNLACCNKKDSRTSDGSCRAKSYKRYRLLRSICLAAKRPKNPFSKRRPCCLTQRLIAPTSFAASLAFA